MFTSYHIAKGCAAALMLTLIGSAYALVKPTSSAAPIEYLQYDLTPYFKLMMGERAAAYGYWRPKSGLGASYSGLFDYAPDAVVAASPLWVEAAPLPSLGVPYIGYDMTPYYNLAPGCPLNGPSNDLAPIC